MKKNTHKILLAIIISLMVLFLLGVSNGSAIESPTKEIEVQGDHLQTKLQTNDRTMLCFQNKTKLMICTNVNLDLEIYCDALKIQEKEVIIEVIGETDLKMYVNCVREEKQLGLVNGSTHRIRNRNAYRYLDGFCLFMAIDPNGDYQSMVNCSCINDGVCNCDCDCLKDCTCKKNCQCICDPDCDCICDCNGSYNQRILKARLQMRISNQNQFGEWAYYNYTQKGWETLPTTKQDGYFTAETTELTAFTILTPEVTITNYLVEISLTIGVVMIIGIIMILYERKRKM